VADVRLRGDFGGGREGYDGEEGEGEEQEGEEGAVGEGRPFFAEGGRVFLF